MGNNIFDVPNSDTDGFLSRDTCVMSTQQIVLLVANRAYLHLETPKFQEVFLSKTNSILSGNIVLDAPASNTDGLF
jgi:hypothetical protein